MGACCTECETGKAPCRDSETAAPHGLLVQASPGGDLAIWGPMSVELPSQDKKLVRIAAVERALPGLLKRARFSILHSDYAAGEIVPLLRIDTTRLPPSGVVQAMVAEVANTYGGLPTGILNVTPRIAAAFPRLAGLVGKPVAFAGGTIYEDDRIGQQVRSDILAGKFDSFSINGASFKSREIEWCDTTGCKQVEEVLDLDLSMVTLCSTTPKATAFGAAQARNPGAAFVVVQQADLTTQTPGTSNPTTGDSTMPMGEYTDFDDCVKKNQDKADPAAYCGAIKHKIEQAENKATTIQNPPKAPTPIVNPGPAAHIKQADDAAPAKEEAPPTPGEESLIVDLRQRLETLEQNVALLNGDKDSGAAPDAETKEMPGKDTDTEEEDEGMESDSEDEDEKDKEQTAMSQATTQTDAQPPAATTPQAPTPAPVVFDPSTLPALIQQALKDTLPSALEAMGIKVVKQADTPAPTPAPAPAPVGVKQAETPIPAPPTTSPTHALDVDAKRIQQAMDRGEPGAIRDALLYMKKPTTTPRIGGN